MDRIRGSWIDKGLKPLVRHLRRENLGVALLTALSLLFVFSMLGVAYLGYMSTVKDGTDYELRKARVRNMAEGGVNAAIGEIQAVLEDPALLAKAIGKPLEIECPVYAVDRTAPLGFAARTNRRGLVKVSISDESGKVNINHAPTRVLQAILGIDGDTARKIRSSLPFHDDGATPAGPSTGWLLHLDDLVTRGFMTPSAFDAAPKNLATVYSVVDQANASGFLNVNAAPPEVLAAILDVPMEAAQSVAAKRATQPFRNLAEIAAAAGKDPAAFNIRPAPEAPAVLPRELSLQSRCFRIVSEAALSDVGKDNQESHTTHSRVEAVVVFGEDGTPHVTFWSGAPQQSDNKKA